MNREIKFRAWDKQGKKMYDLGWLADILFTTQFEEDYGSDLTQYEIMQFTGLKDKNGVEIYESDVVKFEIPDFEKEDIPLKEVISEVTFDEGCFDAEKRWYSPEDCVDWENTEVIGNVFENPDLVKELV